jgi:hypothetical protein
MNHKRWQAIVLVAFAWVLWIRTETAVPLKKTVEWERLLDPYPSKSKCLKGVRMIISIQKLGQPLDAITPEMSKAVYKGNTITTYWYEIDSNYSSGFSRKANEIVRDSYFCFPENKNPTALR